MPYVLAPFQRLDIFDKPGGTRITPNDGLVRFNGTTQAQRPLNAPATHTFTVPLNDPGAQNLDLGFYYEFSAGFYGLQDLIYSGYIQSLDEVADRTNALTIHGASSMIALESYINTGGHQMEYGMGYNNVIDAHNGIPAGASSFPPNHKGFLPPAWKARWVDGLNSPPTTAPGHGHSWLTEWTPAMLNVTTMGSMYNYHVREAPYSVPWDGTLDLGPLGDPSGLSIYGGDALTLRINALAPTAGIVYPDLGWAQKLGIAAITGSSHTTDFSHVINLFWPLGAGDGHNFVSLRKFAGGEPADSSGAGINGWSAWTPTNGSGRKYYVKANAHQSTYNGNSYELIAEQQNNGGWAYGLINRTNVSLHGVIEHTQKWPHIKHPNALLAATLAALEYNSDPVNQVNFAVQHPLTSVSGLPLMVQPGQWIDVYYTETTPLTQIIDQDNLSDTYQQVIAGDSLVMVDFPGYPSTDPKYQLAHVCTEVTEEWTNDGYFATYTMGRGHADWRKRIAAEAEEFIKHQRMRYRPHTWHKSDVVGTPFALTDDPLVWEDSQTKVLNFSAGGTATQPAMAVSDVPDPDFFSGNRHVEFTCLLAGTDHVCDFFLGKDTSKDLMSVDTGASPYCFFRLAAPGSGTSSGFYITFDHVVNTQRGQVEDSDALDGDGRVAQGIYRIRVGFIEPGHLEAVMLNQDVDSNDRSPVQTLLATWSDRAPTGAQIIKTPGAIGWMFTGLADAISEVYGVHGHDEQIPLVKRGGMHPHAHIRHHYHNIDFWVMSGGTHVTIQRRILDPISGGGIYNEHNRWLKDGAGQPAVWYNNHNFTVDPGHFIVWNGSDFAIPDDQGGTIAPGEFGGVVSLKATKMSYDRILVVGRVSVKVDRHTQLPKIIGWHATTFQSHGGQIAPNAAGRRALNPNVHDRFTLHNLLVTVRKDTSRDSHGHPRGFCTVRIRPSKRDTDARITTEDGSHTLATMAKDAPAVDLTLHAGKLVVFDPPRDAEGNPSSITITSSKIQELAEGTALANGYFLNDEENVWALVLGKLSDHVDPHHHEYFLHHWNAVGHQKGGQGVAKKSVGRGHGSKTTPTKKKRKRKPGSVTVGGGVVHMK